MNHDPSIHAGFDVTVDGRTVRVEPGETVLQAAERLDIHVPTLCHDPRLEPSGACRMCLVEVSGQRRLQPACRFKATPGMEIVTQSERIDKHRAVLLSLYLADHPVDEAGMPVENAIGSDLRLHTQAKKAQARSCQDGTCQFIGRLNQNRRQGVG